MQLVAVGLAVLRAVSLIFYLGFAVHTQLASADPSSPGQCRTGDWHAVGYAQGRNGQPRAAADEQRAGCAARSIDVDVAAYELGWQEGIALYCTEESGFELGAAGARFSDPCPSDLKADFRDGYQSGRQFQLAESEIAELESMVVELTDELGRVSAEERDAEAHLIRGDATATDRYRWLEGIKFLSRERSTLESEIDALEMEIESRKEHLELLRTGLVAR